MFLYSERICYSDCYEICYCKYEIKEETIKIEEVIGCYSKGITSLRVGDLGEAPDGEHYFIFGDLIAN